MHNHAFNQRNNATKRTAVLEKNGVGIRNTAGSSKNRRLGTLFQLFILTWCYNYFAKEMHGLNAELRLLTRSKSRVLLRKMSKWESIFIYLTHQSKIQMIHLQKNCGAEQGNSLIAPVHPAVNLLHFMIWYLLYW